MRYNMPRFDKKKFDGNFMAKLLSPADSVW